mgnify:CR=1 FL=1
METPHINTTEHVSQTSPLIDKEQMRDQNNPNNGCPTEISFNGEEILLLEQEIDQLERIADICRVVGSQPNRGLLRDMLQGKFHSQVGGIKEV